MGYHYIQEGFMPQPRYLTISAHTLEELAQKVNPVLDGNAKLIPIGGAAWIMNTMVPGYWMQTLFRRNKLTRGLGQEHNEIGCEDGAN